MWCEKLTYWKSPRCWENWRQKERGWQKRWLDGISDSTDMNLSKFWETVEDRGTWCATVHWVTKSRTWLADRITTIKVLHIYFSLKFLLVEIKTIKYLNKTNRKLQISKNNNSSLESIGKLSRKLTFSHLFLILISLDLNILLSWHNQVNMKICFTLKIFILNSY